MERKFESELARKVADGNKESSRKKKGMLFAAVATCALMFGSAAFSMAMSANDNGMPNVSVIWNDEVDEAQAVDDLDDNADVKRVMNLKARTFFPVGDSGCDEYTKLVYSVTVKINDSDAFSLSGTDVGMLSIGYSYASIVDSSVAVTVDGLELDAAAAASCVTIIGESTTDVIISLPEGEFVDGTTVYFNVSVRIPVGEWSGLVIEHPLPGILGMDVPAYTVDGIVWA